MESRTDSGTKELAVTENFPWILQMKSKLYFRFSESRILMRVFFLVPLVSVTDISFVNDLKM